MLRIVPQVFSQNAVGLLEPFDMVGEKRTVRTAPAERSA